jgi:hypothetical protein
LDLNIKFFQGDLINLYFKIVSNSISNIYDSNSLLFQSISSRIYSFSNMVDNLKKKKKYYKKSLYFLLYKNIFHFSSFKFSYFEYLNVFFFQFLKEVLNLKDVLFKRFLIIFKFFIFLLDKNDIIIFIKNFFKNILINFFKYKSFYKFKIYYSILLDFISYYFLNIVYSLNFKSVFFKRYLRKKMLKTNFFSSFIFSDSSLDKLFNFWYMFHV